MYKVQDRARHPSKMPKKTKNNSIFFHPIAIVTLVPGFIDPGCIKNLISSLQKGGQDEIVSPNFK